MTYTKETPKQIPKSISKYIRAYPRYTNIYKIPSGGGGAGGKPAREAPDAWYVVCVGISWKYVLFLEHTGMIFLYICLFILIECKQPITCYNRCATATGN